MTFLELQTYVLDRLSISSGDSGKVTQIKSILNGERYRVAARYRLLTTTATLDFTAATETVSLPSDVTEVLSIRRGSVLMQPVTEDAYGEMVAVGASTGDGPLYYARSGTGVIRVYGVPSETVAAAATLHYVKRPTALSGDSDTPAELPAEYHELLAERAVQVIALSEEEPGLAAGAGALADRLEAGLREWLNRYGGAGERRLLLNVYGR